MKKIILAIVLLSLSIANFSHASTESYLNQTTTPLTTSSTLSVIDNRFYDMQSNANWSSLFTNTSVKNFVRLKIRPNVTVFTAVSACTVVVNITYKYWDVSSSSFLTSAPIQRTLVVNYDPNTNTTNDDISTVAFS